MISKIENSLKFEVARVISKYIEKIDVDSDVDSGQRSESGGVHSNSITAINQTAISLLQSIVTFDSVTSPAMQK